MQPTRRAALGALGGAGGTIALTAFRKVLAAAGVVEKTAPEQVVGRLEQLGLLDSWNPSARHTLTVAAHLAYGTGIGAAFGLLRREDDDVATETAVGGALGVLSWGVNWTVVLPVLGAHVSPWTAVVAGDVAGPGPRGIRGGLGDPEPGFALTESLRDEMIRAALR